MGTSWRNKSRKPSLPYMRAGHCVALNVKSKDHDLRFGATAIAKGGQTILIRPEDRLLVLKARKVLTVDGKRHGKMTVCRFLTRGVEPGWNELYIRRDYLTSDRSEWAGSPQIDSDGEQAQTLPDTRTQSRKSNTGESESPQAEESGSDQPPFEVNGSVSRADSLRAIADFQSKRAFHALDSSEITGDLYRVAGSIVDISNRLVGVDKVDPVNIALKVAEILDRRKA